MRRTKEGAISGGTPAPIRVPATLARSAGPWSGNAAEFEILLSPGSSFRVTDIVKEETGESGSGEPAAERYIVYAEQVGNPLRRERPVRRTVRATFLYLIKRHRLRWCCRPGLLPSAPRGGP